MTEKNLQAHYEALANSEVSNSDLYPTRVEADRPRADHSGELSSSQPH